MQSSDPLFAFLLLLAELLDFALFLLVVLFAELLALFMCGIAFALAVVHIVGVVCHGFCLLVKCVSFTLLVWQVWHKLFFQILDFYQPPKIIMISRTRSSTIAIGIKTGSTRDRMPPTMAPIRTRIRMMTTATSSLPYQVLKLNRLYLMSMPPSSLNSAWKPFLASGSSS